MRKIIFMGSSIAGSLFHGFKNISKVCHPGWDFQNNKILLSKCATLLEELEITPEEKLLIIIQLPGNSIMPGSVISELRHRSRSVRRIHYHYLKPPLSLQEFRQNVRKLLSDLHSMFKGATFILTPPTPRRHFKMVPACEKCLHYPPELPDQYVKFLQNLDFKIPVFTFSWHEISPHFDILNMPHQLYSQDHIHLSNNGKRLLSILLHNFITYILPPILNSKPGCQDLSLHQIEFSDPSLYLPELSRKELSHSRPLDPPITWPAQPTDSSTIYNTEINCHQDVPTL